MPRPVRELSPADVAAYDAYRRVRDEVMRMRDAPRDAAGVAAPSQYWDEELSNIDYLLDASPLVIRKLRQHAVHVTGIRPYDYREYGEKEEHFERRLRALASLAGGTDLLVGDPEALGGFGYRIDGRLQNVDTLKFFEVLVGMRRAGVLDPFASAGRRMVCEIGGGWGGFAYQLKTLFPSITYVIVDLPEMFLFSATYLSTLFPDARLRFVHGGLDDGRVFEGWQDADFIFVPNDRMETLRGARPDLLVNLVSFQEMTASQVAAYADLSAAIGCRALYSLNRDRSHYNDEVDSVSRILSRHYQLREIRLLGSDYTKATKKDSAVTVEDAAAARRLEETRYRHLAGTLRSRADVAASRGVDRSPRLRGTRAPRVGIGLTLFNKADYVREAIDSILAQSFASYRLVLMDDGSTDGTEEIARRYERDPRVRYVRNEPRAGMVAAWRRAFVEATADPRPEFFAWASDHDRWHPDWLRTLVEALEAHPEVVLAYPLTQRVDPGGLPLAKPAREFETFGVSDVERRWRLLSTSDSVAAGDMVYGLMRVDAAEAAGVFRPVLCPDRLLMAELTLQGEIRQVPEVLWFRRQFSAGSVERQRSTLFAPGQPAPFGPPWYLHARSLWKTYGSPGLKTRPTGVTMPGVKTRPTYADVGRVFRPGESSRARVARMVIRYAAAYAWRHYTKSSVQRGALAVLGLPRWTYKRLKHAVLVAVYRVLVTARRVLHRQTPLA